MKNRLLFLILGLLVFISCNTNDDNISIDDTQSFIFEWHLVQVNGGLAGVNHQFDLGVIIWIFDSNDSVSTIDDVLTITNNNTDNAKEDFLDSGTYNYSINLDENNNGKSYLTIDGTEYGEAIFPTVSDLTLDTNELSTGSGADGFIYSFQRVVITVD